MKAILKAVPLGVLGLLVSLPGTAGAQNSTVSVRLMDTLSTGSSQRGDTFSATLASPLIWQNHVAANQGAHVTGRVTQVVSSGWFKRPALIALSLGTAQGERDGERDRRDVPPESSRHAPEQISTAIRIT